MLREESKDYFLNLIFYISQQRLNRHKKIKRQWIASQDAFLFFSIWRPAVILKVMDLIFMIKSSNLLNAGNKFGKYELDRGGYLHPHWDGYCFTGEIDR